MKTGVTFFLSFFLCFFFFFFCTEASPRSKLLQSIYLPCAFRGVDSQTASPLTCTGSGLRAHPLLSSGAAQRRSDKPISHALDGLTREWMLISNSLWVRRERERMIARIEPQQLAIWSFHLLWYTSQAVSVWRIFEFPTKMIS